jgi:hypothetical protein
LSYRCRYSDELISARRLNDGYYDCLFKDDELNSLYPPVTSHHRYRCVSPQPWQYVSVQQLGNGIAECIDGSDELSPQLQWSSFKCIFEDDFPCWALRSATESMEIVGLLFHRFCDTTWDTMDGRDERNCTDWVCPIGFYQCSRTGQCIKGNRSCDGEFDCDDGEDELNCTTPPRTRWSFEDGVCDRRHEHFCITPSYLVDAQTHRPCIDVVQTGDGYIDCVGARDERNKYSCLDNHQMLGDRFLCSDGTCVSNKSVCNGVDDCPDRSDELICLWRSSSNCSSEEFVCVNSSNTTCLRGGRCELSVTCTDGFHLFWCPATISARGYRATKTRVTSNYDLLCNSYPTVQPVQLNQAEKQVSVSSFIPELHGYCNSGFYLLEAGVRQPVCFCPPSLYGDQCQFSRRRITSRVRIERPISTLLPSVLYILVQLVCNGTFIADHYTFVDVKNAFPSKHNGYLLYPRPKPNGTYSVRYEAFHVTQSKISLLASWEYRVSPLDFLPSLRIAKILHFFGNKPMPWLCSSNYCQHNSTCYVVNNDPEKFFCACQREWIGRLCEHWRHREASCSSKAVVRGNDACVCPEGYLLPHCFIHNTICQRQRQCSSDEICYPHSLHPDAFSCLCMNNDTSKCYSSSRKQEVIIDIDEGNSTNLASDLPYLIQLLKMSNGYPRLKQHIIVWPNQLPLRQSLATHDFEFRLGNVPDIGLLYMFKKMPTDIESQLSLLYVNCSNKIRNLSVSLSDAKRCRQVQGLDAYAQRLHVNCAKADTPCFYTDHYVCYCTDSSMHKSRSECISYYQDSSTSCKYCTNRGLCLKGDLQNINDFVCICPACVSGDLCQFSSDRFSISLEMLLEKVRWNKPVAHLIIPTLLFLSGLICNGASFVIFATKKPRRTGCGIYLMINSVISQFVLGLLVVRIAYLTVVRQTSITYATDMFLCKSLPYCMSSLGLLSSWLMALVTVERVFAVQAVMKYRHLRTPKCALLSTAIIGLCLFGSLFYTHLPRYKIAAHPAGKTWCIMESGRALNQYSSLLHQLIPFLINFMSGVSIILAISRSKARCHNVSARTSLIHQIRERTELLVGPFMCFLTQMPQFALLFVNSCTYENRPWFLHTALLVCYISFLPQVAVLFSYVLPSPLYKQILMSFLRRNSTKSNVTAIG